MVFVALIHHPAAKNSKKRRAARSPAVAISAGGCRADAG